MRITLLLRFLLILAMTAGVLTMFTVGPAGAATTSQHTAALTVHQPSPPPLTTTITAGHAAPDNIGPYKWDRSTVIIQVVKAGNSLEATWFHERVSYMRNVAGSTLNILEQGCVVNMPCVRVWFDFYGSMGGNDGQTTPAYSNCISTFAWCRYDGTSSLVTHTTVQFTRSYIDAYPYNWLQSLFCHELGRALADLQSAGGQTCMQNATYDYPALTAAEAAAVRAKYTGLPRVANRLSRTDLVLVG